MQKHLYFICPTDYLETVIEASFLEENYFLTSLGNSLRLDSETLGEINGFIESKNINEITFVLSEDNRFFNKKDELKLQTISVHLNKKIRELRSQLSAWLIPGININALIYNRNTEVFVQADPDLFRLSTFCLN